MQAVIIQVCVFVLFGQISGERLNNDNVNNKLIKNENDLLQINNTQPYTKCMLNQIIRKIEEILTRQIKESEFQIKYALKPQETLPKDLTSHNRKVRQSENNVDWNKCALRSELEQHKNLETEHILAIKKELEKLQELVRLLRDQQYVLNMLTDVEKPRPKSESDDDQKQLLELFKMLKNNLPAQSKIDNDVVPLPQDITSHNDFQKIMTEISKLQKQVQDQNINHETKLKTELTNQKMQLQTLENEMQNLRNGQAMFINVNPNKTDVNLSGPEIVGARTPQNIQQTASHDQNILKSEMKNHHKATIKHPSIATNPKVRAGSDDFLENLQKILLDNPEQNPETKENPIDLNIVPNSDIENRLNDLEKQLKLSQKMKDLEKKIKQLHQSNAESKNIDNEDEDLKSQLKKLQRQLNNMNKNKPESKSLDEEDILDELKNLQNSINDLKPKEDESQSKIGGADIQVMLNKLIGLPVQPVVPTTTHSHLTPTQIQVLRRIMALKSGSNQHSSQSHTPNTQYGYGLDATSGPGYSQASTFYNPPYSTYSFNAPYNGFYSNVQETGGYSQNPYAVYDPSKQYYGTPATFYPGHEDNRPYGPSQHNLYNQYQPYAYPNKYSYSPNPYSSNSAFSTNSGHYSVPSTKGGYSSNGKYGKYSNMAQYLFGPGPHVNNAQYKLNKLDTYYSPSIYSFANGGYGQQSSAGYYGPSYNLDQKYAPKNLYTSNAGNKVDASSYLPAGYSHNSGSNGYNKYIKTEANSYSKPYGNSPSVAYDVNAVPQSNEAQQFFRGYKDDDSTGYQSDSSQFYSNSQKNSYSENSFAQQKIDELQTQIYKLQNVINNLNSPEYVQKPEDQQTIYELDHKINSLKSVINNLAHEEHYESGYGISSAGEDTSNYKSDSDGYFNDDSSSYKRNRFRRDTEHGNNSTNHTILDDFYDQLSDVVTVINFLSENLSEVYNNGKNSTRTVRDNSKHFDGIREIQKANASDDAMKQLYQQVNKLMYFVDNLTDKMLNHGKTCANGEKCDQSKNLVRNKRDTDDSTETDNAMQRIWDAMTALLGSTESDSETISNSIQKQAEQEPRAVDIHSQRNHLQSQLDHLKQQYKITRK